MLSFSILFYPIPCILPSVYPNPCHVHVYMYIYSILYVYVYVYTHPSNAARGPMHHVLFMCFEPKACCFTVQQNPVTLRDSHPLVDDSSGVNWTTKLNWITVWQKSSKIIKKNPRFFFRIHRCIFSYLLQNDHWNPTIHRCPAQCFVSTFNHASTTWQFLVFPCLEEIPWWRIHK